MTATVGATNLKRRYKGVQLMRGLAAVSVVTHHSMLYAHERLDASLPVWGIGAVQLFFAISGFVAAVSTRSLQARKDGWKYYLVGRGFRILPMYWIATTVKLVVLLAAPVAVLHATFNPGNTILSYFLLPSRNVDGRVEPLLGVGWTLLFEAFFCLVFALALFLPVNPAWFAGTVLSITALLSMIRPADFNPLLVYFDPLVLYFLVGLIIGRYSISKKRLPLILGLSWALALYVIISAVKGTGTGGAIRFTIVTLIVVFITVGEPLIERFIPGPTVDLGNASYSLYLFHPIIAPAVPTVLAFVHLRSGILSTVLSVVVAVACALVIYRFVEKPVTAGLKARLPYGQVRKDIPSKALPA